MLLTLLYVAILVTGVGLLVLSVSNTKNRGTFALLGVGMILTHGPMLAGWMRTTGGVAVFAVGTLFGLLGSLKLLKDARRERLLHRRSASHAQNR